MERCLPDDGDAIGRYLGEALALPLDAEPVRSYLGLVDEARPVTQQHELLVAVRVDGRRAARAARRAGEGGRGAPAVLIREMRGLEHRLAGAGISVEGALTPRMLARALRAGFDPAARAALARIGALDPERAGTDCRQRRADGGRGVLAQPSAPTAAHHCTYWIAEWPRIEVGAGLPAAVRCSQTRALRTIALVMEPARAGARSVAPPRPPAPTRSPTTNCGRRPGFLATARRRRAARGARAIARRSCRWVTRAALLRLRHRLERGLAGGARAGAAPTSSRRPSGRAWSCGRLLRRAGEGFTYTLPLCRGLS